MRSIHSRNDQDYINFFETDKKIIYIRFFIKVKKIKNNTNKLKNTSILNQEESTQLHCRISKWFLK